MSNLDAQWEDVEQGGGNVVKSAQLAIGASFQGKVVAIEASAKYPEKKNLVMEDADGKEFLVFASGSLSFAVEDGDIEIGRTYRVTRLENKATKTGSRTMFKIQRLKADGTNAAPTTNTAKPAGKSAK
jgi:hypothetical protein